jgi:nucleotide-binding universal stress UspA family protein
MLPIRSILHPTDFSPRSDYAFRLACGLAKDHGATVTVLHVLPSPIAVFGSGIVPAEPENFREEAKKKLREITPPADVRFERLLAEGEPASEILRIAEERKCEMIVMGTHGWTGLTRLLMGSVAEKVVRKAPCAVLTVKMPLAAEPVEKSATVAEPAVDELEPAPAAPKPATA